MNKKPITIIKNGVTLYHCNDCDQYLLKESFSIDSTNLHGKRGALCTICKKCQRKRYYKERQRLLNDDFAALRYKLSQALKGTRRRSKERNTYNDLDLEYLMFLWQKQNGKCALTGIDMTYKFYCGRVNSNLSVDRIDSSKGYTKDNVQLVCMAANQMKNDLSQEEFEFMCKRVLDIALEREKLKARTALKNKTNAEAARGK